MTYTFHTTCSQTISGTPLRRVPARHLRGSQPSYNAPAMPGEEGQQVRPGPTERAPWLQPRRPRPPQPTRKSPRGPASPEGRRRRAGSSPRPLTGPPVRGPRPHQRPAPPWPPPSWRCQQRPPTPPRSLPVAAVKALPWRRSRARPPLKGLRAVSRRPQSCSACQRIAKHMQFSATFCNSLIKMTGIRIAQPLLCPPSYPCQAFPPQNRAANGRWVTGPSGAGL